MRSIVLRTTLAVVAAFQVVLGIAFIAAPSQFAAALDLPATPPWAAWMFAMFSARALAFAYGSVLAFRDPVRNRSWIIAMIGVQAIDWIATVAFIASGAITVAQASTAAFMPLLFIAGLAWGLPRKADAEASGSLGHPALAGATR
jgi:hypothetical protein